MEESRVWKVTARLQPSEASLLQYKLRSSETAGCEPPPTAKFVRFRVVADSMSEALSKTTGFCAKNASYVLEDIREAVAEVDPVVV